MKNSIKRISHTFCALTMIMVLIVQSVSAIGITSYTSTVDDNNRYVRTQDAYLPEKTITSLGLSKPEDIFFDDDDILYIADTGNRRIVKYDPYQDEILGVIEDDRFSSPKGVFVTETGHIYVADAGAKSIFIFDKKFNQIETFGKPTTPIFQDTNFEPAKIAVDSVGTMYVLSEGVYSGIIQLSQENEFLGFFTVNTTTLSPMQAFQKLIFNRDQLANLDQTVPNTFSNVFLDNTGIVYTTTMGSQHTDGVGVKKHNTLGVNMLQEDVKSGDSSTDVWVDNRGIMYVSESEGYINVYAKDGSMIFRFGSPSGTQDIAGLFTRLPSIAVDSRSTLWAIDGEKGYLQSFVPTEYALAIFDAMDFYENGEYSESKEMWNSVLQLNQMSILAHNGVGKALLREQDYAQASYHFEISGDRSAYSDAFWEVRNDWLQTYLPNILIAYFLFFVAYKILYHFQKEKIVAVKTKVKENTKHLFFFKDIYFAADCAIHPYDTFYELRKNRKGSFLGATAIYLVGFLIYLGYRTGKGYIYQFVKIEDMDMSAVVLGFVLLLGLFILCNFLITSINDGLGTMKQIYCVPAYSSLPVLICMTIVIALSHVLVENEAFLLSFIIQIGVIWSCVIVFLGLLTLHDYSMNDNIKSIILSALFMIVIAMIFILVFMMWEQLWVFIYTVGKELLRNV
ncbi:MAG: YIP1 family protein [Eubacteriales bacterium]